MEDELNNLVVEFGIFVKKTKILATSECIVKFHHRLVIKFAFSVSQFITSLHSPSFML